jgi:uncharacterized protein (TIGR03435 family)
MVKGLAGLLLTAAAVLAQTPSAPRFEVASVKTSPDLFAQLAAGRPPTIGMKIEGSQVSIESEPIAVLICLALKVKPYQLSGPDWMNGSRFDIQARIPDGVSKDLFPEMMQQLLKERFKLAIHRETKERNIYALVVSKNGAMLKESAPDGDSSTAEVLGAPKGNPHMLPGNNLIHQEFEKMTMASFADLLSPLAGQPVLDMTGLKGNYQVAFDISVADLQRNAPRPDAASDPSGGPAARIVENLGLKLEPRRAPIEIIVIDRLEETPSEN